MNRPFYVGQYRDDGLNEPDRGWLVGTFKNDLPRKNDEVEIKYWEYGVGPTDHPLKESSIIECTFILKGRTRALVNNEEVILSAGDYLVIAPGVPNNNLVEVLEDVVGITVKAPSDPTAKTVLDNPS